MARCASILSSADLAPSGTPINHGSPLLTTSLPVWWSRRTEIEI